LKEKMSQTCTVTCYCGKSSLTFADNPKIVAECACTDCRQKLMWGAKLAGREYKPEILSLNYVVDDVIKVTGEEHLRMYQLRKDAPSHFIAAVCCKTCLAVPATYYFGNYAAVFAEGCKMSCKSPKPSIRYSAGDWPGAYGPLPAYTGTGSNVPLHPARYAFDDPPKGTADEQAGVKAWVDSLINGNGAGWAPGKRGETTHALIGRLRGTQEPENLELEPLELGVE